MARTRKAIEANLEVELGEERTASASI